MRIFGLILCFLGFHRYKILRILKPNLYFEFGDGAGTDLECTRCHKTRWWYDVEESLDSPFKDRMEHPNCHCPCRLCELWRGSEPSADSFSASTLAADSSDTRR